LRNCSRIVVILPALSRSKAADERTSNNLVDARVRGTRRNTLAERYELWSVKVCVETASGVAPMSSIDAAIGA
jgi:hypothetical protein